MVGVKRDGGNVTWTETVPSGTSLVGQFPDYAKSIWTTLALGMATEHFWPGSGGGSDASIGELLPGGSRAFVAAQSASSLPAQGSGRFFLASDVSRLFVYTSSTTVLAGTPFFDETLANPSGGLMARQTGSFATTATSGTTTVTFATAYSAVPQVYQSCSTNVILFSRQGVTAAQFVSAWSALAATGGASFTIYWESLGTMSSASF